VARASGDEASAQRLDTEAAKWDEGGVYRVAAHGVVGALTGNVDGALGAAASAGAAPTLTELQKSVQAKLVEAGVDSDTAGSIGKVVSGAAAVTVGGAVGGGTGAMAAFNEDANNRQLTHTETERIKKLASGDPVKEARLAAAACAMVHCADGVPTNDPSYAYLKSMQDAGAGMKEEQALLAQQTGQVGRATQRLFTYDPVVDRAADAWKQNVMGTRAGGALQAVGGAALVASGSGECATLVGCSLGAVSIVAGVDNLKAGTTTAVTGNPTATYGEQVLQSLGMSKEGAAISYGIVGLSPAAAEAVMLNKALNAESKANQAAKATYESAGANAVDASAGAGSRALGAEVDAIARNGNRLVIDQRYVSEIGDVACGPTACAMVLNDRGQWVNISHVAKDAGLIPGLGTDVMGLAEALQTSGIGSARAVFKATVDDLAAATAKGDAAIVHVRLSGDAGHFVVVDGITTRAGQPVVAVRDPMDGQFFVPLDQFKAKFSGQAVFTNGRH
jgi:filamentous hemagglutinin